MTSGVQVVAGQGPHLIRRWLSVNVSQAQGFAARFFRISLGQHAYSLAGSLGCIPRDCATHDPPLRAVSGALVRFFEHRRALPFDDSHIPGPVSQSTPESCEARCGANSKAGLTATPRGRVHKRNWSRGLRHRTRAPADGAAPETGSDRREPARETFITHSPAPSGSPRTATPGCPQMVPAGGAGGLDVVRKFRAHGRPASGEGSGSANESQKRRQRGKGREVIDPLLGRTKMEDQKCSRR